jgi:hypothetical protein
LANLDWRLFLPGFSPGPGSLKFMCTGIRKWLGVECKNFFLRLPANSTPGVDQAAPLSSQ